VVTGFTGATRAALWLLVAAFATIAGAAENPYLPAQDPAPILAAIKKETPSFVPPSGVTGIIVPHHLLAADLIARGYWAASAGHYRRIIVISPDHFHKVGKAFGTTREDLTTVFGVVASDRDGVAAIAANDGLVELLPTIAYEHGVMAEAPFIRHFWPEAKVIPILASVNAGPAEWRAMADVLRPLATADTLIVQSTDFSHYRPLAEAMARDQESIAAIDAGDPEGIVPLLQPSHLDSKAAGYIQLELQREVFHARPVVLANASSVEYGTGPDSTTSYVVAAFVRDAVAGTAFAYPDETTMLFGGDVLLGRYFLPLLHDRKAWTAIRDSVLGITRGQRLVINLEGVLLDGPVSGVAADAHVMTTEDAAPLLSALKVAAASLANNHANDLGPDGRAESVQQLERLGIAPLQHGEVTDMGAFRLLAINFVGGKLVGDAIADPGELDWVCGLKAAPPLVAFAHWGTEYTDAATDSERMVARALARCGVSLVIGAHSHQAGDMVEPVNGGAGQMIFSLGNLLFDQTSPRGSGALLELRVFKQGTVATRLVPLPNLFELGQDAGEVGGD
jgi:AmmeMemoRadiSam system protein B